MVMYEIISKNINSIQLNQNAYELLCSFKVKKTKGHVNLRYVTSRTKFIGVMTPYSHTLT